MATLTSATCSRSPRGSRPPKVVSAPNGTTAKAANAQVAEMIGASRYGVISMCCRERLPGAPRGGQRATPLLDVRVVLVPEVFERRQHRRHRRVAERAQGLPRDVRRDALQQIHIARLPFTAFD